MKERFDPILPYNQLGHIMSNLFIADYVKNNPRFHIREISKILYQRDVRLFADKVSEFECDRFDCSNRTTLKVIVQSNETGESYSRNYCYKCATRCGFSSYLAPLQQYLARHGYKEEE